MLRIIALTSVIAALSALAPQAQTTPAGDTRFDALVTLAQARIQEYGVPGVALGILDNGSATIRGLVICTR